MSTHLPPGVLPPPPNAVVFGPGANCTLAICPVEISVYGYRPSLAANISFIALYAVAAAMHTYLGIRWKQWWFTGCMLVGAANAIIGYVGRVMLYYNPFNFAAFMLQIICVTSGPVYYCAAIYITLALSINHLSPTLSRLPPHLLYYTFIPSDLLSLVLQGAGGALSVASAGSSQTGVHLALVGLSLQVLTLVVFGALFVDYLVRYFRWWSGVVRLEGGEGGENGDRDGEGNGVGVVDRRRLKLFFGFMVAAVVITLARCAYRLAELHEGYEGEMVRDEGLFIALEGVMVLAAVYLLMIGHPGFVFKQGRKKGASGLGQQELQEYRSK